ncbi:ribonuclease domain-containing protein [Mycolicibacterium sp. HK-90]|uniref:ribonuclease domain-containing protein n=1 Tax=Mycolicibacterium sp. HK-90 TaxID=3056937 RepID=UPI00265B5C99|nr:ribonuclease domain-containing protein [Mycolicibacterium sp. HK-90]WKG03729.1 ribonuclease domain-containing protein [Mycolicibacterium sp. HK-90]
MVRSRVAVLAVLCGLLSGCCAPTQPTSHTSPVVAPPTTVTSAAADGTCDLGSLPPEANKTVELIESGGPFPHPRNDGVVFGNYEGRLPKHDRGYYHEYTVPTPGLKHRGKRRIVTGGSPLTDPPEFYYTGDHYESFCRIGGM